MPYRDELEQAHRRIEQLQRELDEERGVRRLPMQRARWAILAGVFVAFMTAGAAFFTVRSRPTAVAAPTPAVAARAPSLRALPGLRGITFYERSGGQAPAAHRFAPGSAELLARVPMPDATARDFVGTSIEPYDVYFSDRDGNYDAEGAYVTITCAFPRGQPWGGGLNLAEVVLDFDGGRTEHADRVVSYEAYGNNQDLASIPAAIDGDLDTHTTMGNTIGQRRPLRLTVGFASVPIADQAAFTNASALPAHAGRPVQQ